MKKILITGAAGDVGSHLRRELAGRYELRLSDIRPLKNLASGEEFIRGDCANLRDMLRVTKGVDAVVHLGGFSVEGSWEVILRANIIGTYNAFEAARRNGARRIVFATSNHAVGFYRRDETIDHRAAPKPDSRYGVSKAFGEALGSLYADKYGMEVVCMRIGNVNPRPMDKRRLSIWLSPRHPLRDRVRSFRQQAPLVRQLERRAARLPPAGRQRVLRRRGPQERETRRGPAHRALPGRNLRPRRRGRRSNAGAGEGAGPEGARREEEEERQMSVETRPRLKAPPNSCDTHIHIYDVRFPQAPGGPKPPGDFPVEAYRGMQARLGVSRVVIVQPNAYQ